MKTIEEIREAMYRMHHYAIGKSDRPYMEIPANPNRDADLILDAAIDELEQARGALQKISAIRDSIVGAQSFNWSEHAYPLVAALKEAGHQGVGHEIAKRNLGTLLEQIGRLEPEVAELRRQLDRIANHPHNSYDSYEGHAPHLDRQYEIGATDGHRCAAEIARAALEPK